jgi:DNA mismatch repair protein MutS
MSDTLTPMMAQYRRLRAELPPETILFFRLGDFYEMFFDDARNAAPLLDITLTRRQNVPMCGVPYHAAEGYIARLVRAGRKVAICEQMEDPAKAKGLVSRELTRIVTPGTAIEEGVLEARASNYLCALCAHGGRIGVAGLELSTGALWIEDCAHAAAAQEVLAACAPSEVLRPDDAGEELPAPPAGAAVTPIDGWRFAADVARETLTRHFGVLSLDGFGVEEDAAGVCAAGAALDYVVRDLRRDAGHVRRLEVRRAPDYLLIDEATAGNLELVASRSGPRGPTLLGVLDATRTAMGARRMREWLLRPLAREEAIRARHDAVETLVNAAPRRETLRARLGEVRDLERLIARLSAGSGNARDLRGLEQSLGVLPELRALAEEAPGAAGAALRALAAEIEPLPELRGRIERALVDEPPLPVKEGGMIRPGYHASSTRCATPRPRGGTGSPAFRPGSSSARASSRSRSATTRSSAITSRSPAATSRRCPREYIRKQTMANAERFITEELKEHENRILGAHDRAVALEFELFTELRAAAAAEAAAIQRSGAALAALDVWRRWPTAPCSSATPGRG